MQIRNAEVKDLTRIMEIYATARRFMADHNNPRQWGATNWPPKELIETDIQQQKCYVCTEDEHIIGVFFYDYGKEIDDSYRNIEKGQWISKEKEAEASATYGVVHRIASDGSKKGIGSFCINWAFDQCGCLRMDTHPDNTVMQNLLNKLGFKYCGIIHVPEDNDPRFAYEKL